jgi:choline dehydrogenase-like flavoprotein
MHDYVIVGAGSAGCVLAARLTEDPDVNVCLIEAGGPDTAQEIHMPVAFSAMFKTGLDWDMLTEREPHLDNRRIYLPRGKMLGGSSSINAMVYIRGNSADYDEWAANGADGWSYDDVLPYFKKAETNERGADEFHGAEGPLSVIEGRSMHPLTDAMIEAAVAAGHERNPDFNGARQEGVGRFQVTQRNGLRCSAAVAYLHPAMTRPNLEVITGALTHRILFDGDRAVGVEISRNGALEEIRAEREVILSAGAYNTPVIMMLSGIGPAADLELMMIPVREDLPVGENLQDHPMVPINYLTDEDSLFEQLTPENIALLEGEGRGPLASNIAEGGMFIRTRPGLEAPDIQFHFAPGLFFDEGLAAPFDHGYGFGPVVLKPTSRGKVSLRGLLPDAKPRILHNYLATEEDRESMLAGMKVAMEMTKQAPLKAVERAPWDAPESDSDEDLMAFVRKVCQTVYHPTSTCAIGEVVDSELRVMGVPGLRVVDASVMPSVVRGNTNAPTIMIAEKAADLIKG